MPLYKDSGVSMLKISSNKRKISKYQKYTQNSRKINANHTAEVIKRCIETRNLSKSNRIINCNLNY